MVIMADLIVRGGGRTLRPILMAFERFTSNTRTSCLFSVCCFFVDGSLFLSSKRRRKRSESIGIASSSFQIVLGFLEETSFQNSWTVRFFFLDVDRSLSGGGTPSISGGGGIESPEADWL